MHKQYFKICAKSPVWSHVDRLKMSSLIQTCEGCAGPRQGGAPDLYLTVCAPWGVSILLHYKPECLSVPEAWSGLAASIDHCLEPLQPYWRTLSWSPLMLISRFKPPVSLSNKNTKRTFSPTISLKSSFVKRLSGSRSYPNEEFKVENEDMEHV